MVKVRKKKNGLTAPTLLANISQMELNKKNSLITFVRLGLKILCGDFGKKKNYFCNL